MQSLNKENEDINKQANKQTGKKQYTINTVGDEKRRILNGCIQKPEFDLEWGGVGGGGGHQTQ